MMNRIYMLTVLAALSVLFFSFKNKSPKLLIGGSGWNKIAILDKETKKIEWSILWKKAGSVIPLP